MANVQRSGSQKAVLVFSILALISGIIVIIVGISSAAGGMLIASESSTVAATAGGQTMTGGQIGAMAGVAGVVMIISGVMALLEGIFGIRAANDATKAKPYIIMAAIALVLAIFTLIVSGLGNYSAISAVVIDALCVYLGVRVNNEGKMQQF